MKRDLSFQNLTRKLQQKKVPEDSLKNSMLEGQEKNKGTRSAKTGLETGLTGHSGNSEKNSRNKKKKGRVSKSSWPSTRKRKLSRGKRNDQMKPKVPSQSQHLAGNRILTYIKIIVLLCQILGRLLHSFGHILIIIHLWIIVGCIRNHIIFNIFLCIQIVFHKDRLAIIWSKKILIAARRVRWT